MIFDMDIETLPREELEALQLKRLKALCERVYANVAFYRKAFDERGITPADIRSLSDVRYLPFTEKQDLRNHYPFGLFAVPKDNVVRIHASSGTTGRATVAGYTQRDVNNWATMMARSLTAAGATRRDIIHVAYGYGLFTGGLGAHYGAERLGAITVPVSGGGTRRTGSDTGSGATGTASTPGSGAGGSGTGAGGAAGSGSAGAGRSIASAARFTFSVRQPGAGKNHIASRISSASVAARNSTHAHFISSIARSPRFSTERKNFRRFFHGT